jgi:RHS repeat-associated protein
MTYTLGLSVLTQGDNAGTPNVYHLMYDGHGSVRLLTDESTPTLAAAYAYDAYGNAEGFTPGSATTRHLYAGEQYDAHLGSYYLRARWYDAATGRFNRMDPFAGNSSDPKSLHKYTYAHANPVMGTDPSGLFTLGGIAVTSLIVGSLAGLTTFAITGSIKAAIFVGVLAALITAAIMLLITFWPAVSRALKAIWDYQKAHRTVSDKMFRHIAKYGDDIAKRNRFFDRIGFWRLWLRETPIGYAQNLLRVFADPRAFLSWLNPTPAGWAGLGTAIVVWLVIKYRDNIADLLDEYNSRTAGSP